MVLATAASQTDQEVWTLPTEHDRAKLLRWLEQREDTSGALCTSSPGTGEWFLNSQPYLDWVNVVGSSILWCTGAPGTGKSTLASMAVRDLLARRENNTAPVAYYFCDFAAQQQQDLPAVLQSILRQVVAHVDIRVLSTLMPLKAKARQACDTYMVSDMLNALCKAGQDLFIVLDAPDELTDSCPVISFFTELATIGARILITSRDVGTGLADRLHGAACMTIEASKGDIEKFVHERLQDTEVLGDDLNEQELAVAVASKANGIFLLARILIDKVLQSAAVQTIGKSLESMPSNLHQAYLTSLRCIERQSLARRQLARRVISWVTHARRRLNAEELQHALAMGREKSDEDKTPRIDSLINICAGLVIITGNGKVGMIHTTAYEFFRNHFSAESHIDIARTSIQYLRQPIFRRGGCETQQDMEQRLAHMPFLSYAANYCGDHVHEAEAEQALQNDILDIVSNEGLTSTAFQAIRYNQCVGDQELAEVFFDSTPSEQNGLHLAAYWNFSQTLEPLLTKQRDLDQLDSQRRTALHWACFKGSLAAVKVLVTAGVSLVVQDSKGWTPLFWPAFRGDVTSVEFLLQNGARCTLKDKDGWSALKWATVSTSPERNAVVRKLLAYYQKDRESPLTEQDESPLDLADARGDASLFESLLTQQDGLDIDIEELWTPELFDAPIGNKWRAAHKGESMYGIEYSFDRSSSLLNRSIRDGKRTVMRVLLDLGAFANPEEPRTTRSPLHWATFKQDPQFVQDLLNAGADVNCLDMYGQSALHQAVVNGSIQVAALLIQSNSDVNLYRAECEFRVMSKYPRQTPLMLACGLASDGYRDGAAVSRYSRNQTHSPSRCTAGPDMVSLLLTAGADPHAKDGTGRSVMHYAVLSGQLEIVKRLLAAGATFESRSAEGVTLLHDAAKRDNMDILELVAGSVERLDAADARGKNIFHYLASRKKDDDTFERLAGILDTLLSKCGAGVINAGCSILGSTHSISLGEQLNEGVTPLALAFSSGNWPLATLFHEKGALLPDNFPTHTWLRPAVYLHDLEGVRLLLRLGVRPNEVRWPFFTGLHKSSTPEDLIVCGSIIKMMVDAGLDINKSMNADYRSAANDPPECSNYNTILSTAVSTVDDDGFIQLLLDLGADPFICRDDGMSCFHIAALSAKWITLDTLLTHIAEHPKYSSHWIYASTKLQSADSATQVCQALREHGELERLWGRGATLLHLAAMGKNHPLVSSLLAAGADPSAVDTHGFTALHHSAYASDSKNIETLIRGGADINAQTEKWHDGSEKPSGIYEGDAWAGTPLHLAAMQGHYDAMKLLIDKGADVTAEISLTRRHSTPSHGPTALHLILSTGTFYGGNRTRDLCEERLKIAEMLIERGASVRNVARHLRNTDAKRFKGRERLWETLRAGIQGEAEADADGQGHE